MAITKFDKNNKWNLEDLLCEYKKKINEIIDILNNGGDVSPQVYEKINELVDSINSLTIDVISNTRNIKENNNLILTNSTNIENLQDSIESLRALVGENGLDTLNDINIIKEKIATLEIINEDYFNTNKENISLLTISVDIINESITDIRDSLREAFDSINSLTSSNVSILKDIEDIKAIIDIFNSDFSPILDNFETLSNDFNSLHNELITIRNKVSSLETDVLNNNNDIYVINKTLANYESRLNKIEGAGGNGEFVVIDSLESTSPDYPLSANQGRILKEFIDNLETPNIEGVKDIDIDENGDILITNQDDTTKILELPSNSSSSETNAVIGIDANDDGTISYGFNNGEVASKDTPYVNNVIKEGNTITFKRNTGDITVDLPSSSSSNSNSVVSVGVNDNSLYYKLEDETEHQISTPYIKNVVRDGNTLTFKKDNSTDDFTVSLPKYISKLKEDTMNDGIGITYSNGDYERMFVKNIPTIAQCLYKLEGRTDGTIRTHTIKNKNGNSTYTDAKMPYFYNATLEEGVLSLITGKDTQIDIDFNTIVSNVIAKSRNSDNAIKYYKNENGEKIEITKQEFNDIKPTTEYHKEVDGISLPISEKEFLENL